MNLSSRSLWATFLVLGAIGIGYFLVLPEWNKYQQASSEVASAEAQQQTLKQAQAQLNAFLGEYQQHTTEAEKLNRSLPLSKTEMANLLNNLDSLTKSSGLSLGQLNIVDSPGTDTLGASANAVQEIDLSISGSGNYDAFKSFLGKLETNLRIMDVSSVTMEGEDNDLRFSLNFKTYYQK